MIERARPFAGAVALGCAAVVLLVAAPALASTSERRGARARGVVAPTGTTPARSLVAARGLLANDPASSMRLIVESERVIFDEAVEEVDFDRPGAVSVRVFSDQPWSLTIVPDFRFVATDNGAQLPVSRLSWRTAERGGFVSFRSGEGAKVARGSSTGGAGELVHVDLRLRLGQGDPLGRYQCDLRLVLEPRYAAGAGIQPRSSILQPTKRAR